VSKSVSSSLERIGSEDETYEVPSCGLVEVAQLAVGGEDEEDLGLR
jgi:hypothetical protein